MKNEEKKDLFITKESAHEFLVKQESQQAVIMSSEPSTVLESRIKRDIDRGYHEILEDEVCTAANIFLLLLLSLFNACSLVLFLNQIHKTNLRWTIV